MKLIDLINAKPSLDVLVNAKLPVKTAWKISRALPKLEFELSKFDEAKAKLGKEHGTLSEDGKMFTFDNPEKIGLVQKELDGILHCEVDVEMPKLKLDDLGDIEMTAGQMAALSFMLEE